MTTETPEAKQRKRRAPWVGIALATVAIAAWSWAAFAPTDMGDVFVDKSYDAALAQAGAENKVVFISFRKQWCPSCKLLDRTTFSDRRVQKFLKDNAVSLHVDAEQQMDLSRKFQVHGLPAMFAVGANGEVLHGVVGYLGPEDFLDEFKKPFSASVGTHSVE